MSKSLVMIAFAFGVLTLAAGPALAGGGCGYSQEAQSVSLETQTASTGSTLLQTSKPETKKN